MTTPNGAVVMGASVVGISGESEPVDLAGVEGEAAEVASASAEV
jgi:hypothetical protein